MKAYKLVLYKFSRYFKILRLTIFLQLKFNVILPIYTLHNIIMKIFFFFTEILTIQIYIIKSSITVLFKYLIKLLTFNIIYV